MALLLAVVNHLIDPLVLQGRIERLRPAHPGPAHRRASAVAFQVPGELLGGVLAPPVRVEYRLPLSCAGACGPPYRSPRTPGAGATCCRPNRVPDRFPRAAALGRSPGRSSTSPGAGTGGCRPSAFPAGRRREPAPEPGRRHHPQAQQPRAVAPGPSRQGRGLAGPGSARAGARRLRARLNASAGPGGTGCGASPQGGARAVEDPLDQGAEPLTRVVRVLRAAPLAQAQHPDPDLDTLRQRHTMVTGQTSAHRGGRKCAPGRLPGPPARRKEAPRAHCRVSVPT